MLQPFSTGGVEETRPLGSGEGKVPGARMLGVTHSRAAGQVSDLHAVLTVPAVAALPEAGGDVGNFDAVNPLAAVAALVEVQLQSSQDVPSRVLMWFVTYSVVSAALMADACMSSKVALYSSIS